jgi:tRNA uridine 5-carboxymethylaminomethyl modification enzyme
MAKPIKLKRMEDVRLPEGIDYQTIHGLYTKVREKLSKVRPISLEQTSRIAGMTPINQAGRFAKEYVYD